MCKLYQLLMVLNTQIALASIQRIVIQNGTMHYEAYNLLKPGCTHLAAILAATTQEAVHILCAAV